MRSRTPLYRSWIAVCGLLAIAGGLFFAPSVRAQGDPTIFVVNEASLSIYYLYVSPVENSNWGNDLLGDGVIITGERFRVSPARGNCVFDIKVVYSNDQEEERRRVNFCQISELVFRGPGTAAAPAPRAPAPAPSPGGGGGNPDFELVNRSSKVIYYLYVSPVTSDSWGEDRLGSGTLSPGARFTVDLPQGQCSWDIRIRYADNATEERRNVDLCQISELAFAGPGTPGDPPAAGNGGGNGNNARPAPGGGGTPGGGGSLSSGTGFFVSSQGHALTNNHVAGECRVITALVEGARLPAQLVRRDEQNDLALIRVQSPRPVPFAQFRGGQGIRAGESVLAAGFPLSNVLQNGLNVTVGNVSALAGIGGNTAMLQITAPVQPGNSGGPLLDMGANVVGVVVAKLDQQNAQNVNFAVQGAIARLFLESNGLRVTDRLPGERPLPVGDVSDAARTFTFQIECQE